MVFVILIMSVALQIAIFVPEMRMDKKLVLFVRIILSSVFREIRTFV